jgi:mycofactocin precursor
MRRKADDMTDDTAEATNVDLTETRELATSPAGGATHGADVSEEGNQTEMVDLGDLLVEEISIDGMCGVY